MRLPTLSCFVLVLAALAAAPSARAQEVPPPDSSTLESAVREGRAAGRLAAEERGVKGYFLTSFAGGLPVGFVGLLAFASPAATVPTVAGGSLIAGSLMRAKDRRAEPHPPVLEAIADRDPAYRQGFRAAYAERMRQRRTRAAMLGGGLGVAAGFGTLVLLFATATGGP